MNETLTGVAGGAPGLAGLDSLVSDGGPIVILLLAMSVLALGVVVLKLWQFARLRLYRSAFIGEALASWREGHVGETLSVLGRQRNPIATVMAVAVEGIRRRDADALVREEAARVGAGHLEGLCEHLRTLEIVAALSPLLGLLGTVLGMIEAFQRLESAAGTQVDPSVLSGGIWEALLTTAVGLAVAIPATMAQSYLERVIERYRHRMEDALTRVFTQAPAASTLEDGVAASTSQPAAADAH